MEGKTGLFELMVWIILILLVMHFMIVRPNKKKMAEYKKMLDEIKPGDNIAFSGGIHGKIKKINGDVAAVEIAKGVEIEISKGAISGKI